MPLLPGLLQRREVPRLPGAHERALVSGAVAFVGGTLLTLSGLLASGRDLAGGGSVRSDHAQRVDAGRSLVSAASAVRDQFRRIERRERSMRLMLQPRERLYEPCPPAALRRLLLDELKQRSSGRG